MKIISMLLLVLSLLAGCQKEKTSKTILLNNTIEAFKSELPKKITFYREKNNLDIKKHPKLYFFGDAGAFVQERRNIL